MSIDLDIFYLVIPFMMLFAAVLSFSTGVGGCWWTISARAVHMDVAFCQFSNSPLNSASMAYVMIFLVILHSTCAGSFSGALLLLMLCCKILGRGKNIHLICCVPLVLIFRMHLNIYIGSLLFLYIMQLHLDVTHCNSRTG